MDQEKPYTIIFEILIRIFLQFFLFYKNGKVNKYKLFRTMDKSTKRAIVESFLLALGEDALSNKKKYAIWMEIIRPFMIKRVRKFDQTYLDVLGFDSEDSGEKNSPFSCDLSTIIVENDDTSTINMREIITDGIFYSYCQEPFSCDVSAIGFENDVLDESTIDDGISSLGKDDISHNVLDDNTSNLPDVEAKPQDIWSRLHHTFIKFLNSDGTMNVGKLSSASKKKKISVITKYFAASKIMNRSREEKLAEWDYFILPFHSKYNVLFFGDHYAAVMRLLTRIEE